VPAPRGWAPRSARPHGHRPRRLAGVTDGVVRLGFAPRLQVLLAARHRGREVEWAPDRTSSLGHVVESLGVPLPEVGALLVGGRRVLPSYRPRPADVVLVEPVRRPQPLPVAPARFVLDVHLGTLARRLRLLGVDTDYRTDADDDELVAVAVGTRRVLLTQDRGLLRRRALPFGAFVYGARPADQLADVLDRFDLPLRPWTRCTACNGLLAAVPKREVEPLLRPGTRRQFDSFTRCRGCGQVYWRGAHARRLDALVADALRNHPAHGW
jgi:uncharacterized protein